MYTSKQLSKRLKYLMEKYSGLHLVAEAHAILGATGDDVIFTWGRLGAVSDWCRVAWVSHPGIVKLLHGFYLNLIMDAECVGNIAGHAVYAIKKTALYQISAGSPPSGNEARCVGLGCAALRVRVHVHMAAVCS